MAVGIDPLSDRPVFRQIADSLRARIVSGDLAPGDQLPSERDLTDSFGVARGTVREAIKLLMAEGLIESEHGKGMYVRNHPPVRRLSYDRFARRHRDAGKAAYLAEMDATQRRSRVEVIQVAKVAAPVDAAARLGLALGDPVLIRSRRYFADDFPMELATSYVPWRLAEGTPMVEVNPGPGGIYARLEEIGHVLGSFTEDVTARMPTREEAHALKLGPGVPILHLIRTAIDRDGVPVEICDTIMAADRYSLSYALPAD